jgi:hypothetical protein
MLKTLPLGCGQKLLKQSVDLTIQQRATVQPVLDVHRPLPFKTTRLYSLLANIVYGTTDGQW